MKTDNTPTPRNTNSSTDRLKQHSYQDGYLDGRVSENRIREENHTIRENNSAASGLLLGIGITAIAALIGGTLFFFTTDQDQPATAPTQTAPVQPSTTQPPSSQSETTIIERTVDRTKEIVPVPQQPAPQPETQVSPAQPEAAQPVPQPETQVSPAQPEATQTEAVPEEAPEPATQP